MSMSCNTCKVTSCLLVTVKHSTSLFCHGNQIIELRLLVTRGMCIPYDWLNGSNAIGGASCISVIARLLFAYGGSIRLGDKYTWRLLSSRLFSVITYSEEVGIQDVVCNCIPNRYYGLYSAPVCAFLLLG